VDVVGHIENEAAIIRAIEAVDKHAGIIIDAAQKKICRLSLLPITARWKKWLYPDGAVDTGHTDSQVPFILLHPDKNLALRKIGELTDIAPTVLNILGLKPSPFMTGSSLIKDTSFASSKRLLLIILDGWGLNENVQANLISRARTPVMDNLAMNYPMTELAAAGRSSRSACWYGRKFRSRPFAYRRRS